MKKIAFVFLAAMAVLSFAGCKKKGGVAEAMAKMEGFKNDMCACKDGDKACAEKVANAMKAYGESMKGKEPDEKSVSDADKKKMMDMMGEMAKCQTKAMGMGGDMAAPPAGGAAPPAGGGDPAGSAAAAPPPAGGGDMKKDEGSAAAPPAAGGDMKKEEEKK